MKSQNQQAKKKYANPRLVIYGNLQKLTQAVSNMSANEDNGASPSQDKTA